MCVVSSDNLLGTWGANACNGMQPSLDVSYGRHFGQCLGVGEKTRDATNTKPPESFMSVSTTSEIARLRSAMIFCQKQLRWTEARLVLNTELTRHVTSKID